jgi:regulator of sigma E protease
MNTFWSILLNIVIFFLSITVLIVAHEAGHLSMAKIFKVYCYEFSVGMGPAIYQKKPKKDKGQETIFSVRALPIGGYVSMAGEDIEDAEGVDPEIQVPKERMLEGKPHWQRIIIMAAGVIINFIGGYILFLIQYGACPYNSYYSGIESTKLVVEADSKASAAGLLTGDQVTEIEAKFYTINTADGTYPSTPTAYIKSAVTSYTLTEVPADYADFNTTVSAILSGVQYQSGSTAVKTSDSFTLTNEGDKRIVVFTYTRNGQTGLKTSEIETLGVSSKAYFFSKAKIGWETIGVGCPYEIKHYSAGEAFKNAGDAWTESAGAIYSAIAKLFVPAEAKSSLSSLGSIVAIFEISTVAVSYGFASYLSLWGLVSVNLAIVNLLPFPGLDGWQILITVIEWIANGFRKASIKKIQNSSLSEEEKTKRLADKEQLDLKRKKNYMKVKKIVSTVGLILLLVLAAALIVKDIIVPVSV